MRIERISPKWLGIGVGGSLLVLLLVLETAFGRWDELRAAGDVYPLARVSTGILRDLRLAIVHCLLIGYLPAALLHAIRNARRTVLVLQDALACTREECNALAESIRLQPRWLVLTGLLGLSVAIASPYLVPPVPSEPWNPSEWNAEMAWHRILGPPIFICLCWLGYAVAAVSTGLSRLARKLNHVDLLDLSLLAPFTRVGLTNSLLLIGSLSIASLMLIETGFGALMLMTGVPALAVAVLALISPVYGVHKRIRQSKEAELRRINGAIAKKRSAFLTPDPDERQGELADLVAYRGLIQDVPEWPFTSSTYTRFALYMLIPVISWSLGIVAEEIVSRVVF